jgi:uracil-DNA glycosylase
MTFHSIRQEIIKDSTNHSFTKRGWKPIYTASASARIVIVGQAPGRKAQESGIPWNDASGDNLRAWLGIPREIFYNDKLIALIPMDFYFPGKGLHGDLPPRKDFARRWHPTLFSLMPNVKLTILVGKYAQDYYLKGIKEKNLTETVKSYKKYLPIFFPLVHPSPLTFRWQAKNPWFKRTVLPDLKNRVKKILNK